MLLPCRICGEDKPASLFSFRKETRKYRTDCTPCRSTASAAARYGVSVDDVLALAEKQGHRCAVCGVHKDELDHASFKHNPLVIDHDHVTGRVRGLLCPHCNLVLGNARDRVDVLANAIAYLTS